MLTGMKIFSLPDITGDGAAHPVSATHQQCRWFQIQVTAAARVGDSNISAARGAVLDVAGAQFAPPISQALPGYDLNDVYLLLEAGGTASVLYAI